MNTLARNKTFDIVRALCMLWIVGFWHLGDYIHFPKNPFGIGLYITNTVLACFCFISGYFIGKKNTSPKVFYIARLKRFYLLFFISCLTLFFLGWFDNVKHFFFSITGLSCFFLPQPRTIWFFCMMIIFYLITPFLIQKESSYKNGFIYIRIILSLTVFLVINYFHHIDLRVPMYFIFYSLGLLFPFSVMENLLKKSTTYRPYCLLLYAFLFFIRQFLIIQIIAMFVGILLIIFISNALNNLQSNNIKKTFSYLSYSSMCAYLFHRQIYTSLQYCFNENYSFVIALISLCLVLIIGGRLQKVYDYFTKK